jgi:hypothetical protein
MILLKVALNTKIQIQINSNKMTKWYLENLARAMQMASNLSTIYS